MVKSLGEEDKREKRERIGEGDGGRDTELKNCRMQKNIETSWVTVPQQGHRIHRLNQRSIT